MFKPKSTVCALLILGLSVPYVEMCNPIACFFHVHDFFRDGDIEDYCGRTNKTSECIETCFLNSPEYSEIRNGLKKLISLVCNHEDDISVGFFQNKQCIDHHKYRILACVLEAIRLENIDNHQNPQILKCRKIYSLERCPSHVLQKSCERAVDVVERALHAILQPVSEVACSGISLRLVWDLEVYSSSAYTKLFRCIDRNQKWISSCIPEKWVEEFSLSNCSAAYSTKICIQDTLGALCGDEVEEKAAEFFTTIYKYVIPYCDNSTATVTLTEETKDLADEQKIATSESLPEVSFSNKTLPKGTTTSVILPQETITLPEIRSESVSSKKTDDITNAEVNPKVLIVYNIEKPRISESTNSAFIIVETKRHFFIPFVVLINVAFYNNEHIL